MLGKARKREQQPRQREHCVQKSEVVKKFGYLWRWKKAKLMGTQGKRDAGEAGKVHRDRNMQDLKATPGFIGSFQVQLQGSN